VLHVPKLLDRGCGQGVGAVAVHDIMTLRFELEFDPPSGTKYVDGRQSEM